MNNNNYKKLAPGIGLIFGVAIGTGIGIVFENMLLYSGIGAALGLIFGAMIQSNRKS